MNEPSGQVSEAGVASACAEAMAGESIWARLTGRNSPLVGREAAITFVALAVFALFSIEARYFFTLGNLLEVARFSAFAAIVGVGWTYLLITAELDLSVGPMYSFMQIMCAWFMTSAVLDPWLAFLLTIVVGAGIGAVNGTIVTVFRVPSFIVTLGMLSVMIGAALVVTGGFPITVPKGVESSFFAAANGNLGPVPAQVLWMLGVCLLGAFVLKMTPFGSRVYATGGNERAARQAGINTARVKFSCFVITGALVGLAGGLSVGWLRTTSPVGNQLFTIQVIAAVIVGGTSLYGGAGSVYGTLIGALLLGSLSTGLILMGASIDWTFVFFGSIIIVVGTLDVLIRHGQSGLMTFWRRLQLRGPPLDEPASRVSGKGRH